MPGDERRVGVEIEFALVEATPAADAVARAIGGRVTRRGAHVAVLEDSAIGRVVFELDTRFAKPADDPGFIDRALEELDLRETAANVLSALIPVEMVTEPLDAGQLVTLDRAIAALREAGAVGTKHSPVNAFGMHLNIAIAAGGPARAIRIAAAYACVEAWLRRQMAVDLARRATPFVDPYPPGYLRALARAFAGGTGPTLAAFIELYAEWNPTRNRGLDMWPLLGHLDRTAAEAALGAPVKNARPAFHYRLPDSDLENPGWTPRSELARWDAIEAVADDAQAFEAVRGACLRHQTWRIGREEYDAVIARAMA